MGAKLGGHLGKGAQGLGTKPRGGMTNCAPRGDVACGVLRCGEVRGEGAGASATPRERPAHPKKWVGGWGRPSWGSRHMKSMESTVCWRGASSPGAAGLNGPRSV